MPKAFEDFLAQVKNPQKSIDPVDAEIDAARDRTDFDDMGEELLHFHRELRKHGVSLGTLLRHVSKTALGIDVSSMKR